MSVVPSARKSLARSFVDRTGFDTSWKQHGACHGEDPNRWFPEDGHETGAEAVCAACPVRAQCLHYAIESGEKYGVWGGVRQNEIARIRRDKTRRLMAQIAAELEAEGAAG